MTQALNKLSNKRWQYIASKIVRGSAIAGTLVTVSGNAEAVVWPWTCREDCYEHYENRKQRQIAECELDRQQADADCNSTYEFGSLGHQVCRMQANETEMRCTGDAEREANELSHAWCDDRSACS
jgi:hypothetical protein